MTRMIPIFLLTCLWLNSHGQENLIPNGSFEIFGDCPNTSANLESVYGWYDATDCTVDFLHECAYPTSFGVPVGGVVDAVHGQGVINIGLFGTSGFREYAAIKLDAPLIRLREYIFSINLHLLDPTSISVGSFGVYFASDSAIDKSINHQVYELEPQLQRDPDSIMSNFDVWYEWHDTIIASGIESYMLLGNFLDNSETPYIQSSWYPTSLYLLDNVRLTLIPDTTHNGIPEPTATFTLAPNPSTDRLNLEYSGNQRPKDVRVYSITGRQMLSKRWQRALDVSELPAGLYFVEVVFENDGVGVQRFVKE